MMTKEDKIYAIHQAKSDANTAKDRLISIEYELRDIGAIREANTLSTIICKLETWQNK